VIGGARTALSFLTRIPAGGGDRSGAEVGRALIWFPAVGLLIGAMVGAVYAGLGQVTPTLVAAGVAVAAGVVVTGGFHEDGLADMADGFGGGWTTERRLEIMDDPRNGTYGVLALTCSVVIRVAAVAALAGWRAVAAVSAAHVLARSWTILAVAFAKAARPGGLGRAVAAAAGRGPVAVAAVAWLVVAVALVGPARFGVMAGVGLAAAAAVTWLSYRKIGGVSGDVLGAIEQLAEIGGLVAAAATVGWWW
jgi:adenosylcobinamide-GDP ribazoletransferase